MKTLSRSIRAKWISTAILIILCIFLVNCGDSNIFDGIADEDSKEARTEEALIAMDDGDYDTAISILSSLVDSHPDDDTLIQYLSSAYAGSAGLDTLDLIEVIDELDDAGSSGSIDMVGLVLGGDAGQLSSDEVDAKLADIEEAIAILSTIGTLNEDQRIQLGVLSVTHLSLTLADLIMDDRGVDQITLTEEGIDTLYGSDSPDFSGVDAGTLDEIDEDLDHIATAITDIQEITDTDNDLAQDFNDFLNDIDPGLDNISIDDLENYIDNLNF